MKPQVVVVGAESQLGKVLKPMRPQWLYISQNELNLLDTTAIANFFKEKPKIIINFAAFTAVDLAEQKKDEAMSINAHAVRELARSCDYFVHISTDYVFAGEAQSPYLENAPTNPINHYGATKLAGEELALSVQPNSYIVRTSWLYSEHNVNFVKRMIELGRTRESLNIVDDQRGCPTLAHDLVGAVVKLVEEIKNVQPGIYHYSNEGECSWYEFTKEIFRLKDIKIPVKPISTSDYPTPAKRPKYSVLSKTKIKAALKINIPDWRDSLARFLKEHL